MLFIIDISGDKFFAAVTEMIGDQEFEDDSTSTFQFELTKDGQTNKWCIDPANKKIHKGGIDDPTCTFGMSDEDFMKLMAKEVEAAELFMSGRMKLEFRFPYCLHLIFVRKIANIDVCNHGDHTNR